MSGSFSRDVVIVGGCGHVGLPLGLVLADAGISVTLYDLDANAVDSVRAGKMPFWERDADAMLERLIATDLLDATIDPDSVSEAEHVVLVVGTPVDEHLNPDPKFVRIAIEGLLDRLRDGQHVVLRSTVYPRVTAMVEKLIAGAGRTIDVSFCPERIAEGKALEELRSLPQIVSARTEAAVARADGLFGAIAPSIVHLEVEEAELAKLFANTWRYIQFAAANQLFMIANDFGLDFGRIRDALKQDYPRLAGMPGPGLAAGPCLLKDTMQLAAFNNNNFTLGHASMMINEGLPMYMVSRLEREYDLTEMTVGILGMAFKAESDDTRSSLSYKLKRLLRFRAERVLCTDPYAQHDDDLSPLAEVLAQSDLLVIATPHRLYADIDVDVPVVDVWNLLGNGERVTPRVSVVIPVYNEGDAIVTCLDRLVDAITLPCEILVVYDSHDDSTRPYAEKYAEVDPRVVPTLNSLGRGPAFAIRAGIEQACAPVVVVTMADGSDDPTQVDELARLIERGVVVAAASRYMPGGAQLGAPWLKSRFSMWAGLTLYWFARVGTHDATSSFKAYDRAFVQDVGIESDAGFELAIELVAKARRRRLPVGEIPTIWLERTQGASNFKMWKWLPRYFHWYFHAFGPREPS